MTGPDVPDPHAPRPSPGHVVLMGLRGSGKTTLGSRLAAELARPFVDLDDRTLALLGGGTVAEAWASRGEAEFRRTEVRALREALASTPSCVLSLGGGTPTAPGATGVLSDARRTGAAIVVYLRATPAELRQRLAPSIAADPNRPSLTGKDPLTEIDDVFTLRDGLYRALAERTVEVDGLDVEATAARVLSALAERGLPPGRGFPTGRGLSGPA